MAVDDNKQTVKRFYEHLDGQEFDLAFALMIPDATWWIPSDKPGGTILSKEAMRAGIGTFYSLFMQMPSMEYGRMTAEGDRVCLEQTSRGGRTRGGASYGNDYHMLFQFRDGLIAEVREYMNPLLGVALMAELGALREEGLE
jgi:ketosteroid isomerase-like protein